MRGTCRHCLHSREIARCRRFGGGTYKRPSRWYWSSICRTCAATLLGTSANKPAGFSRGSLAQAITDLTP